MPSINDISEYLASFTLDQDRQLSPGDHRHQKTRMEELCLDDITTNHFINEFWTARQRQSSSLHEISYRACFKPQLPRFFIELLTSPAEIVYDPFAGRGTTPLEAALLGRNVVSNDINPLSKILSEPRLNVPSINEIRERLLEIPFSGPGKEDIDLAMFYHPQTETELLALRSYFAKRQREKSEDATDRWIKMVATNRLTGHSKGFFSVYSMPPNQAVSAERQKKINLKLKQKPEYRDVKKLIVRKSSQLVRNLTATELGRLRGAAKKAVFLEKDASKTKEIAAESISLTVTSPPFLDIVQYSADNWLRCWFNNIDIKKIEPQMTTVSSLKDWALVMNAVFKELKRITRPGGWVAFEVGEVRRGSINLEETIVPLGLQCGFDCAGVVVNRQHFTKTSNIWGIKNNSYGTNSNRIVLFRKPGRA